MPPIHKEGKGKRRCGPYYVHFKTNGHYIWQKCRAFKTCAPMQDENTPLSALQHKENAMKDAGFNVSKLVDILSQRLFIPTKKLTVYSFYFTIGTFSPFS